MERRGSHQERPPVAPDSEKGPGPSAVSLTVAQALAEAQLRRARVPN